MQVIISYLPVETQDDYLQACLLKFYHAIKQNVLDGKLVIVDMVLEYTNVFYKVLGDLPLKMILIYTPLQKILKNLAQRNLSEDAYDRRVFTSAMRQFHVLYRCPFFSDELSIDTIDPKDFEMACTYLKTEAYWEPKKIERFCHFHYAQK